MNLAHEFLRTVDPFQGSWSFRAIGPSGQLVQGKRDKQQTLLALNLLQYSQHWQASDMFRAAPMPGPAPLCHGARQAVFWFLTFPLLVLFGLMVFNK